jgi:hypothetical protein
MRWGRDLAKVLRIFDEAFDHFDGGERVVYNGRSILSLGIQDIWRDDGGDIVKIHFTSRLLVDMRECSDPKEEFKDDLHAISITFR